MDITANKTINYDVNKITINAITLNLFQGKLEISAPFEWKDTGGVSIKKSVQRITEADLIKLDPSNSALVAKLKAILPPKGMMKNMNIMLGELVTARANFNNPETKKWESIAYTQEQLETLLNGQGLSVEAIKSIVSALAMTLT